MFRTFYITLILACLGLAACDQKQGEQPAAEVEVALTTDSEKLSYGLGQSIGQGVAQQKVPDMNIDTLIAGMTDSLDGKESRVSPEELQAVVERIRKAEAEKAEALAAENGEKAAIFLADNAKKEGVMVTESGLQYEIVASGNADGKTPAPESKVKTHYHGTLIDGTVFDSSVDRGEPAEFGVNQVIPGWTEALQLMKEGDKWRIYLPADLAYGQFSPGPTIPPNSALIFDIELLEVVATPEPAEAG